MAWVTEAEVREVAPELDAALTLTPFITTAESVITAHCSGLTITQRAVVDRWLSAHFAFIATGRAANEKADVVGQGYQYKVGLYLENTMYGQQAMLLDTTGGLAALNARMKKGLAKSSVEWLGESVD